MKYLSTNTIKRRLKALDKELEILRDFNRYNTKNSYDRIQSDREALQNRCPHSEIYVINKLYNFKNIYCKICGKWLDGGRNLHILVDMDGKVTGFEKL